MVENICNFTAFTTFLSKSTIFTAFADAWPPCYMTYDRKIWSSTDIQDQVTLKSISYHQIDCSGPVCIPLAANLSYFPNFHSCSALTFDFLYSLHQLLSLLEVSTEIFSWRIFSKSTETRREFVLYVCSPYKFMNKIRASQGKS